MKAVLILINGNYRSNKHEEDLIKDIISTVCTNTDAEGANALNVKTYDETDLLKLMMPDIDDNTFKGVDTFKNKLISFCNKIHETVGDPILFHTDEDFKLEFIKYFVNDSTFRTDHKEVITYLVKRVGVKTNKSVVINVLKDFHLENIGKYIKEINDVVELV